MLDEVVPPARSVSIRDWEAAISAAYYRQDACAQAAGSFDGELSILTLGAISLSRIQSSPVSYRRRAAQIAAQAETCHLVTVPLAGELFFDQGSAHSRCPPRCFLTERGDLPYELFQPGANELLVLKVPEPVLDGEMPRGRGFRGHTIGRPTGFGGLFIDFLRSVMANGPDLEHGQQALVGRHALDLLVCALSEEGLATESAESAVREAHLRRIKAAIRKRLYDSSLTPADVAAACGLSVRYVHRLFSATGTTMGRWTIEQRLTESDGALRDPRNRSSIAMVAQHYGFSDQSQFCRHYKRRFGRTPRDTRAEAQQARRREG